MSSYLSILGISTIDNVVGNNLNVQNVNTNSISVSSLTSGLVSSNASGTLQNALIGSGLSFSGNTLNNTGLTSISSGATGPVYISTSSTGSVHIALPQNLTVGSSPNFQNLGVTTNLIVGSTSSSNTLLGSSAGYVVNAPSIAPLSYNSSTSQLSIALTGSTGVTYDIVGGVGRFAFSPLTGSTGPIGTTGPQGFQGIQGPQGDRGYTGYTGPIGTGTTGPMGPVGAGGGTSYNASYYSLSNQTINSTNTQILFPSIESQTGISMSSSNITFTYAGTYNVQAIFQITATNNSRFYIWYKINGTNVANSGNHFDYSGGANETLGVDAYNVTVNAGDILTLWAIKTAGTVTLVTEASGATYPATPSVTVVVNQVTYSQIGPTGYTGPMGPIYTAGTNINIASNVISTVSNPTFERILNSSLGSTNLLLGTNTGSRLSTGGGCLLIGQGSGNAITSGTFNIGLGASTYGGSGSMTQNSAQNVAIGNSALFSATTTANNNVAVGYQALQTLTDGNNNTAVGVQAGQAVVGGIRNTLIGNSAGYSVSSGSYNTLCGASPSFILTTGSFNTSLGYLAGQSLITGSNNLHLGYNTQASSSSVSNEIVIGNSSTITQGKGTNTCYINASAGLYSYKPAFYWGYTGNQTNGSLSWNTLTSQTRNMSLQSGDSTKLLLPYIGFYEISLSGSAAFNGSANAIHMYVNGVLYISSAIYVGGGYGWLSLGFNSIVNCTSVNTDVRFYVQSGSITFQTSPACILTAKFISL